MKRDTWRKLDPLRVGSTKRRYISDIIVGPVLGQSCII